MNLAAVRYPACAIKGFTRTPLPPRFEAFLPGQSVGVGDVIRYGTTIEQMGDLPEGAKIRTIHRNKLKRTPIKVWAGASATFFVAPMAGVLASGERYLATVRQLDGWDGVERRFWVVSLMVRGGLVTQPLHWIDRKQAEESVKRWLHENGFKR